MCAGKGETRTRKGLWDRGKVRLLHYNVGEKQQVVRKPAQHSYHEKRYLSEKQISVLCPLYLVTHSPLLACIFSHVWVYIYSRWSSHVVMRKLWINN